MDTPDSQVRVKVYQHEEGPDWNEIGTGFCTLEDYQGVLHLNVASEYGPNRMILDCVVQQGEVYQHQETTQIVWTEPTGEDIALSFENQEGCLSILNQITEFENALREQQELELELEQSIASEEPVLPKPSMDKLTEISRIVTEAGQSLFQRDKLVGSIIDNDYIGQLHELHEVCEDLGAIEALHVIYDIVKHIILLNSSSLFEHIIRDDTIVDLAAMLEYDPDHPVEPGTFRELLHNNARYKQIVPIKDPEMKGKIHQTFRLQCLKDVMLLHILDDGTLPVINALIFFNHAQIASYIQGNHELLAALFRILEDKSASKAKKRDVVFFVHQLGNMARSLPVTYRIGLYRTLNQYGVFMVFEYALQEEKDIELLSAGIDILLAIVEHDRALVRSNILEQSHARNKSGSNLLRLLISGTQNDIGSNSQAVYCEIVRALLETALPPINVVDQNIEIITAPSEGDNDTEGFLTLFYDSYASHMMAPLLTLSAKTMDLVNAGKKDGGLLFFLCETLSMMITRHGYRARSFVFSSSISRSICMLFYARHGHLKLAALRFIRSCAGLHDEAYNKYLVANRLIAPIVALYVDTYLRDNLIVSACREFFSFIANCQIPSLLTHIIGTFGKALEKVPEALEHLRRAYNEYLENIERAKNGSCRDGLATPTVDTGRHSTVSVNIQANRDNSISSLLNVQNGVGSTSGPWGCSIADEMEDAYLESSYDEDDFASATIPLTIAIGKSPIDVTDATTQSPEIDNLQDCLDIYSDSETSAQASSKKSDGSISAIEDAMITESDAASRYATRHWNSNGNVNANGSNINASNNIQELGSDNPADRYTLPALTLSANTQRQAKILFRLGPSDAHGNHHQASEETQIEPSDPIENSIAPENDTTRASRLTDMFPDRQPIARKSLPKRPTAGRIEKRFHVKPNVLSAKRTLSEIIHRKVLSKSNGATPAPLSFLKRQRSYNSSTGSGSVSNILKQQISPQEPCNSFRLSNGRSSNGCIVSNEDNGDEDKNNIGNLAFAGTRTEDASPSNGCITLSYPQNASTVIFASGNPSEDQTPPKKARTASI